MRSVSQLAWYAILSSVVLTAFSAAGEESLEQLWSQFQSTRQASAGLHQEFEITQKFITQHGNQATLRQIILDFSQNRWREKRTGGSGDRIRVFDGANLFVTEPGETEYLRSKPKGEKEGPLPEPYGTVKLEWRKAKEIARVPCGFPGKDHTCVVIEAPLQTRFLPSGTGPTMRVSSGVSRVMIDTETGIWVQCRSMQQVEASWASYQIETSYALKKVGYDAGREPGIFQLPESATREVKQLTPWDAARIKKQLVGNPAPELQVADIEGNPISLASLKGKTVLLDFWTTWCPPCQADAPSIEKLHQKYGAKDLAIIGFSVSEERETVEHYLKKHPHNYPVILTSENQLPRPYQIGIFPTYLIIATDGTVTAVEQGDQGFGHLRKTLEKAGMATD